MRKLLTAFVGSMALAAAPLALSAEATKELKMAYDADPVTLDIHEQLSGGMLQLSHMTFDPLIRWNKDLGFDARLAESWERIDDKTMRFKLREGVKFHSGNELTTKDVVFTYDRLKQSSDFKAIFAPFNGINVIDDYTFELVTAEPYPLLLNTATYIFPMDSKFYSGETENGQSKAAITKHGSSFASGNLSGTGPYIVTSRQQGVRMEFERFADYWDEASPGNVKKIVLTPIKENNTRVSALLSGGVDFIAPVPPTDLERIKRDEDTDLVAMSGTRIIMFHMNQDRVEAFKNPKVRQAVAYAINQEGIAAKIMKGFATPAAQMSPAGYSGHNESLKPRYDVKKAQELMKEAGYEDGFTITMMSPNNRYVNDDKIAQAAAAMLARINITVDLKTLPKAQYWPEFDARSGDMMLIGWHADTEDSANFFEFLTFCPNADTGAGQYNAGNYCNPEIDALVAKANVETDREKRAAMLQDVEKQLYDDAAFIPLHWQDLAWASKKNVKLEPILNVMNFPYLGDLVVE
ncbi:MULTISPECIES: ABC transporter substrate-binding protein [Marinobacter]|jgi:peptide/nickel transport system substrate-binding protein|uniref:ABC transporter substrate-binding protein n=1 Tax=Marinobacter TaxID=2742 RepID=UPI0002776D7C|nr:MULTISPECIES: ABC transporter substrate-binding protein [Marinobacter]AFP29399.1 Glutathione-binding protein gsiB [Marinobacter sp. BSs20148]MBQ0762663.1 ABC transporter substrate-binding protein [Marinobacter psychrophilus]MBQ0845801.1 ABC transporter substrate-binding protein [Marinobacter psychrophilus]